MKTRFTLLCLFFLSIAGAKAAVIPVAVTSNQFTPANITNVQVGDIIRFNFTQGFHNASSLLVANAIPPGAAPINSGSPSNVNPRSFDYTVTTPGVYRYICDVHADPATFTGMVAQFTVQGVLPATLKGFSVIANYNKQPIITWNTLSELNVSHFSVRVSYDGVTFTEAGQVKAVGNAVTEQSYSYTHSKLIASRYVYYMLAIIDKDGKEKFSEMKIFKNSLASATLIARMNPNPVPRHGQLMLQFNAEKDGQLVARVFDAGGKFVMQAKMSAFAGLNNGHLHAGDLPPGTYTAEFILNGMKETKKIFVQ